MQIAIFQGGEEKIIHWPYDFRIRTESEPEKNENSVPCGA